MESTLSIRNVTKRFGDFVAVDDLTLDVPRGSIYGILGPNGAGKSTTLRMVMNIIGRDTGSIDVLGADPARDREVLRRIGYLPEERGLYKKMSVLDVIVFFAQLKGLDRAPAREKARVWLERMDLADRETSRVETLSKGMQQKVQFIATVLHEPEILILDEPTSGLDPVNQEVLRETIVGAKAQGGTVLLSTHNMLQAQQMCDYVCIIARGAKILDGRVDEIRRSHRGNGFYIEFDQATPSVRTFMEADHSNGVHFLSSERSGLGWRIEVDPHIGTRALVNELNSLDAPLCRFEHLEPSLHEIFVAEVGGNRNAMGLAEANGA
jgi:ABC-2 type transport system ATP-binding protein